MCNPMKFHGNLRYYTPNVSRVRFQSFPLLYAGGEAQTETSTWVTALFYVKLIPAAVVDYLAEKVDKCSLNENCPLYKVAGCLLFRAA